MRSIVLEFGAMALSFEQNPLALETLPPPPWTKNILLKTSDVQILIEYIK